MLDRAGNLGALTLALVAIFVCACPGGETAVEFPLTRSAVRVLLDQGRFVEAESLARQVAASAEQTQGAESLEVALALDLLVEASTHGELSGLAEAAQAGERALAIKETLFPKDDPAVADSLIGLAVVLDLRDDFGDADAGRAQRIQRLFERAYAIRRQAFGDQDLRTAKAMIRLGIFHNNGNSLDLAAPLLEDGVEILQRTADRHDPFLAYARMMYGCLLWLTGDLTEAKRVHELALEGRVHSFGPDHEKVAGTLSNLAALNQALGDPATALAQLRRARAIFQARVAPGDPRLFAATMNLADLLEERGEQAEADALLDSSLTAMIDTLGPKHPWVAYQLHARGDRCRNRGQHDCAAELYGRALDVRREVFGPLHPQVAESMIELARSLLDLDQTDRALELLLAAEDIGRRHQVDTHRVLAERQALNLAGTRSSGLGLAIAAVAESSDARSVQLVWDALIVSRALVLDELATRRRRFNEAVDPQLSRRWEDLREAREHLAALAVQGPDPGRPADYREAFETALRAKERAERLLARESAEFAGTAGRDRTGYAEVAGRLPPGSALLAYALVEDTRTAEPVMRYVGFLSTGGSADPVAVPLETASEIDVLIAEYRRQMVAASEFSPQDDGGLSSYRKASRALRSAIWDPLLRDLSPPPQTLFVVPDGALNAVSLATLPVGETGYVIDTGPAVHYLTAERDLVVPNREGATGEGLLALGNPTFATADSEVTPSSFRQRLETCGSLGSARFSPLPATAKELETIVAQWRANRSESVTELTRSAATERAFKRRAPGKRILHLATHGFFLDATCNSGPEAGRSVALAGSPVDAEAQVGPDNPFLLSGVALADEADQGASEDGILTAEEVASLDLSGVEWAVLSACDTGVGAVQAGEGVLGLRRAFAIAGASTLIMSLWPVDDKATRDWMGELYAERLHGSNSINAVQQASLGALQARRETGRSTHPFFWGAFVAVGDWR